MTAQRKLSGWVVGAIALLFGVAMGFVATARALDVPPLTGRIVDLAHLLPSELAASLSQELAEHERRTGNQVAVLTIPTLEGEPLEEFSHRVATTWKLGQKGADNGLLLLVVPQDRRVRIEVGYGLEGVMTDAVSSQIIRNVMVPHFRNGHYDQGLAAGVRAILGTIGGTYAPPADKPGLTDRSGANPWLILWPAVLAGVIAGSVLGALRRAFGMLAGGALSFLIALSGGVLLAVIAGVFAVVGAFVLSSLSRGAGRAGWPIGGMGERWGGGLGGGFSGGDSFSGGGGDFGGGGASGRW